jgi:hypothetical protein
MLTFALRLGRITRPKSMPRPSNPQLRLLRFWKRQWRESPNLMEEARQRAVQASQMAYHDRNLRVRQFVLEWPTHLTNPQLRERCLLRAAEMGFKPRSFKTKVVRLGLIAYDPKSKLWVNQCLLPAKDHL